MPNGMVPAVLSQSASAEVSLAAAPWPCCPLGGKLFGQGPQESTQEWICYVDESLGVPRLHHFQLAFLYWGRSKVQENAFWNRKAAEQPEMLGPPGDSLEPQRAQGICCP